MTNYSHYAVFLALLTPVACGSDEKRPAAPPPPPAAGAAPPAAVEPTPARPQAAESRADATGVWLDPAIAAACGIGTQTFVEFDAANVRPEQHTLNGLASCLSTGALKGRSLRVVERTGPPGPGEGAKPLDRSRAASVAEYLTNVGMERSKIRTEPRDDASALGADGRAPSPERRVEIRLAE